VSALKAAAVAGIAVVVVFTGSVRSRPMSTTESQPISVPTAQVANSMPAATNTDSNQATSEPVNCRKVKCVALTFDDGPVPQTVGVLNTLKRNGARATFFVLGASAQTHPEILRRMVAGGNAVGDHSWNHPMFSKMSLKAIRSQLKRTDTVITRAIGAHRRLVRPPYGEVNARVRKAAASLGAPLILWSVDPLDWKDRNTKVVTKRVLAAVRRNSIVLMHDIHPTSRAAVDGIIKRLQARGYVLVTVPELIGSKAKPGARIARG
jgi:peptidoglycan/xylan/chitin deacetylase (PgdA/CDA1 family)